MKGNVDSASIHSPIYLVDLENVGVNFLYQHVQRNADAEYVVFCSESTALPGTVLDNVPDGLSVSFIDCRNGEANAMDFCICAMAGRLSGNGRPMRILSNDKGYDPMVDMMHRQGIRIKREAAPRHVPVPDGVAGQTVSTSLIGAVYTNVPKKYQQAVIEALPGICTRKKMHEALQAALPTKLVADVYKKLKKHIPKERTDI